MQVSQLMKIVPMILPLDITAGLSSDVVNMAKWNHLAIYIQQGAWAGGAPTLTVEACSNNTPTLSPDMDFYYRRATMGGGALSDVWGALTWCTSTGLTMLAVANSATIIELDAAQVYANPVATVPANAGYHRVRITITAPAAADLISVTAILTQYRYAENLLKTVLD
ncbi:MAG: hypothetical protein KKD44_28615 [Proteobacteria bacterium]|nr:hypothetical protein [Pseudomonadota bacterium]